MPVISPPGDVNVCTAHVKLAALRRPLHPSYISDSTTLSSMLLRSTDESGYQKMLTGRHN